MTAQTLPEAAAAARASVERMGDVIDARYGRRRAPVPPPTSRPSTGRVIPFESPDVLAPRLVAAQPCFANLREGGNLTPLPDLRWPRRIARALFVGLVVWAAATWIAPRALGGTAELVEEIDAGRMF